MRRTLMAVTVAAALAVTAGSALAAPRMAPFGASGHAAEQVQYYPDWHARTGLGRAPLAPARATPGL